MASHATSQCSYLRWLDLTDSLGKLTHFVLYVICALELTAEKNPSLANSAVCCNTTQSTNNKRDKILKHIL